jgi:uncharacterized protein YndB with AHSA1/START domain
MIKKILLSIVAVLAVILIIPVFKSPNYRVERSRAITAPPAVLFEYVNSHKKFNEWNPFVKMDPEAKMTYTGPEAGVGAVSSWVGPKTGEGSATITESKPGELVRQRMDWKKPMEGVSTVEFTFEPVGDETLVTWAMFGESNYLGKLMSLVMDCEKMCGPPFEQGLADLEKLVTAAPAK